MTPDEPAEMLEQPESEVSSMKLLANINVAIRARPKKANLHSLWKKKAQDSYSH